MNLHLQRACDRMIQRNHTGLVELRRDIVDAVRLTARLLEPVFEDPSEIHGQMHCTNVRGLLIRHRESREAALITDHIRPPLPTHCGQGMSVVLTDVDRAEIRVRKAPAEVFSQDRERVVMYPRAAAEEQLSFGPEFDEFASIPEDVRWYVLWTLSPDSVQVPDVFLAAVTGIDDPSRTFIWASAPLPRAVPRQGSDDDFDDFEKPEEGSGSPNPA